MTRPPDQPFALLGTRMLTRVPEIIAEAQTAVQPRLTELYDEAAEWRDTLAAAGDLSPDYTLALHQLAHAVVMCVSAAFTMPPAERVVSEFYAGSVKDVTDAMASAGGALAHHYSWGKVTD